MCRILSLAITPRLTLAAVTMLASMAVHAGEWRGTASIGSSLVLADHRSFTDGSDPYAYIALTPRLGLNGKGARVKLNLSYGLSLGRSLVGDSNQRFAHNLNAAGNIEVVEDTVFVSIRASAGLVSRVSNGLELAASDNIDGDLNTDPIAVFDSDNQVQTFSLSVSPRSRHRLPGGLLVTTSLRLASLHHADGNLAGGSAQGFNVGIDNSRQGRPFTWRVTANTSFNQGNGVNSSDSTRTRLGVTLGYRRSASWRFRIGLAHEINDVNTSRNNTDGLSPTLGVTWTPNARTNVRATFSHRYYGYSANVAATHRTRRTRLAFTYQRTLSNAQTQLLELQFVPVVDEFGEVIIDPDTGDPLALPLLVPSLVGEDFINETLSLRVQQTGRRTRMGVTLRAVRRSYEVSDFSETSYLGRLSLSRTLGRGVSARASVGYQTYDRDLTENQRADVNLGFSRRLGRHSSASLNYRHTRLFPDGGGTQAINRVVLSFRTTLR